MTTTMETTDRRTNPKTKLVISRATEQDLPALVELQFAAFATLPIEVLINGTGTAVQREAVLQRHLAHIQQNPGLHLVKVEEVEVREDDDDDNKDDHNKNDQDENQEHHNKSTKLVVGSCMFYLPNSDAATAEETKPPSLRRSSQRRKLTHAVADETQREVIENFINDTHDQLLSSVADRPCAYVRYMAVRPSHQRRGIGSMLMRWGCALLDEAGIDAALEATARGELLYRNHGFTTIGRVTAPDGTEHGASFAVMWRNVVVDDKRS